MPRDLIEHHNEDEGAHVRMREARIEPVLKEHNTRITFVERAIWILTGIGLALASGFGVTFAVNHLKL